MSEVLTAALKIGSEKVFAPIEETFTPEQIIKWQADVQKARKEMFDKEDEGRDYRGMTPKFKRELDFAYREEAAAMKLQRNMASFFGKVKGEDE